MGVQKRFLETRTGWIKRVLESENVDYAIGRDKSGAEWLYVLAGVNKNDTLARKSLIQGPSIGYHTVTDDDIRLHTSIKFYSHRANPTISGVNKAVVNGVLEKLIAAYDKAQHAGKNLGYHVFTDPIGRKWYFNRCSFVDDRPNSSNSSIIRLMCEKNIERYGGMGGFERVAISEYYGDWHLENLNKEPVQLDPTTELSIDKQQEVPKNKRYELVEEDRSDEIAITVIDNDFTSDIKGLKGVKRYKLIIDLTGTVTDPNQVYNVGAILSELLMLEFNTTPVVLDESKIKFILGPDRNPYSALSLKNRFKHTFYNNGRYGSNVTIKNRVLHDYFA